MEWLNLHTSTLDSPEVIGAEPVDRATWLFLLRYCIAQENGGRIANCADWGDRKWQQLVRVTLAEVKKPSELWRFEGNDIAVNFYPVQRQREIEAKRKAGRDTVAKRWESRATQATAPSDSSATSSADSSAKRSADTEGEGEGERKDKGKGNYLPPAGGELFENDRKPAKKPAAPKPAKESKPRPRDPLMDALATVGGGKAAEVTQWASVAVAMKQIKAVAPELTPFEIARRAENYRTHYPECALTPTALAKHWALCDTAKTGTVRDEFGSVRAAGWGREIKIDRSQANSAEPVPFT